jgi:hypothetical protein
MIVIFSVLLFFNCSKDEIKTVETKAEVETANQSDLPLFNQMQTNEKEAEKVRTKIRQFRERLKTVADGNALDKNGGTLTIEEAIWNIEAVLNATYANAGMPFEKLAIQTSNIVIPTENGYVSDMDVFNATNNASAELANHYNAITSTYRHPIVIDVELESTANNEIVISMKSVITEEPPTNTVSPIGGCNIFDATNDYWNWGWDAGRCNGLAGGQGLDAADILEIQLNARIPDPANTLFFAGPLLSPIFSPGDYFNPNDLVVNDGHREFLMFSTNNLNTYGCIPPADMQFYYCSMYDVINQEMYTGYSFISIDVWDDFIGGGNGSVSYQHRMNMYMGVPVTCPCPPCPPGTPTYLCPQCC